jgi:hypothetical protein
VVTATSLPGVAQPHSCALLLCWSTMLSLMISGNDSSAEANNGIIANADDNNIFFISFVCFYCYQILSESLRRDSLLFLPGRNTG